MPRAGVRAASDCDDTTLCGSCQPFPFAGRGLLPLHRVPLLFAGAGFLSRPAGGWRLPQSGDEPQKVPHISSFGRLSGLPTPPSGSALPSGRAGPPCHAGCRQGRSLSTTGVAGGRRPPHQAPVSPLRKPAPRRARSLGGGSVCRSDAARSVGLSAPALPRGLRGPPAGQELPPWDQDFVSPSGRLIATPTGQGACPHPQGSRLRRPPFWAPASPPWEPASTVACSFRDLRWASGPPALTDRFAGSAPEGGVPSARCLVVHAGVWTAVRPSLRGGRSRPSASLSPSRAGVRDAPVRLLESSAEDLSRRERRSRDAAPCGARHVFNGRAW